MQVHVLGHCLPPGVQRGAHAHLPVQALGIVAKGFDSVPDTVKQAPVHCLGMQLNPGVEAVGNGKYHMVISHRQHVLHLLLTPLYTGLALALGAMAVAAGVIARLAKIALIAVHELPAQGFGTAQADVAADAVLRRAQTVVLLVTIQKAVEYGLHRSGLTHHPPPGL